MGLWPCGSYVWKGVKKLLLPGLFLLVLCIYSRGRPGQCLRFIPNLLLGFPHVYLGLKSTNDLLNTFLLSLYPSLSLLTFTRSFFAKLYATWEPHPPYLTNLHPTLWQRQAHCSRSPAPARGGGSRWHSGIAKWGQGWHNLCSLTPKTLSSDLARGSAGLHCRGPSADCPNLHWKEMQGEVMDVGQTEIPVFSNCGKYSDTERKKYQWRNGRQLHWHCICFLDWRKAFRVTE